MWGATDERQATDALRAAYAAGITLFDTAPAYGDGYSEELIGKALSDRRQDVVLATKVSGEDIRPDRIRSSCEQSLKRLNTDYIDLLQQHWPTVEYPQAEILGEMQRLKEAGLVREIGVSNYGIFDLQETGESVSCVSNQLPYNLLFRAIEHEILPATRERGMGVLAYSTLLHGLLSGKFKGPDDVPAGRARTRHFSGSRAEARHGEAGHESATFQTLRAIEEIARQVELPMKDLAVAWVLHRSGVCSALAGARDTAQARENAALAEIDLSPDTLRALDEATADLKTALGNNPDMWQSESRVRHS